MLKQNEHQFICKYCGKQINESLGIHIFLEHPEIYGLISEMNIETCSDEKLKKRLKKIGLTF